jgi:hypothetical protein
VPPRPVAVRALVDSGAARSIVQASIPGVLGLDPVDAVELHTASTDGTPTEHPVFAISLFFSGFPGGMLDPDLRVVEIGDLGGLGAAMLLGRDVLDRCLLIYAGPERRFTIAFGSSSGGT